VARRKLADVEEALGRLTAGTFGYCEQCEGPIPDGLLAAVPERRYCPYCEAGAGPAPALSGQARV
jgi:RNA polymerase-binding transcription factor DksA